MKNVITTVCLLFVYILTAYAQKGICKLEGTLVDAFTREALPQELVAYVELLHKKDSTVFMAVESVNAVDHGNGMRRKFFTFHISEQSLSDYILKFEADGYETVYKPVHLVWKKNTTYVNIWNVPLRRKSLTQEDIMLNEVTVTATKIKFYLTNDTLIYNADAFQLQEGSLLDGLIAQFPGAELKSDGQIFVNGKKVESLLLNGRDFFKGDNTVLLDNLPAYMVDNVKVYHKESDNSKLLGRKVDPGQFVMDVRLKRQYEVGWLANAEGGYGTEDRYLGRLFAMRYTKQSRVSLFGNLNNVNARRKPDGNGDWGDFEPSGGLTTTKHGGVDYSVYDKRERFQLNGNAEVRYTDTDNDWSGLDVNLLPGGDVHNVQQSLNRNSNLSVSTNHNFKFQFPNRNGFSLSPWFNYAREDSRSDYMNGAFSRLPSDTYTDVLDSLYSPNWTTTLRNLIRRNTQQALGKTRRTEGGASFWSFMRRPYVSGGYSIEADVKFSDIRRETFDHFSYHHYDEDGTLQADIRNRYNASPEKSWGVRGMAKYFSKWTDDIMFNPNYTLNYDYMSGDRMRYRLEVLDDSQDQALGWLPSQAAHLLEALDRDNSYESDYHRYRHTFTLDWQWNKRTKDEKGNIHSYWYLLFKPYLIVEQNNFDFRSFTSPQRVKKTYVLPQFTAQLNRTTPGQKHYLQLNVNIVSASPAMTNLVDWTSTADPLNVTVGNPGLKQRTDYSVWFNYSSGQWLSDKGRSLWAVVGWNLAQNAFSMRTYYDKQTGVSTTQPININGNWDTYLNSGYSTPLDKQKRLMLTNTEYITYYHSVDYSTTQAGVDPVRTAMKAVWVEDELNLDYRFKKVSVGLLGAMSYGHIVTDRADFTEVNTWKIRYGANTTIDLPWALQLSTDLTMFSRRGFETSEMNTDELVWNARLSKRLCKNRLTLMVDAWDILGNLSDMNNGVNSQSRWETYTNVIPSYVLFRVSYRFAKQPKKKN